MNPVQYYLEGAAAVVVMDDGKANALSTTMIEAVDAALSRAESEARAVVLVGRPDRFSAGFDLKIMLSSPDAARDLLRAGAALFMRIYGSPLPIIAACTGHALAGGALLLLASDVRLGASGAYRIGLNELSIGMPLPVLAAELARDRLSPTELGRATLGAQVYAPPEAAIVGFLDRVTLAEELREQATKEAVRLGSFSRTAYHATKARLRQRTIEHVRGTLEEDLAAITIGMQASS